MVSLLLFWQAEDHPLSLISEGAPRRARSPATPEIFWDFGPLRRRPPMEQDDVTEDDSAIAAASERRSRRTKRSEDRDAALGVAPVPQLTATQPGDFVPQQLESGASKLDDIFPELLVHLRPMASFCPEDRLGLIIVLRTFMTNAKPRTGRSATDLLVDMVGKESGPAGHRAARVAGLIRQMGTLADMTAEICLLFSPPATATAVSGEAAAFGVSDDTLNRALAWA